MKAVILAGGFGTRLAEETSVRPKPMVEVGDMPLLWHIMKTYSHYGVNEFVICLGYKGYVIKEYFQNYYVHTADVTVDLHAGSSLIHNSKAEPWTIHLVETGMESMTGGRLKRAREFIGDDTFCMTYGDGLADINIAKLINFHRTHNGSATVTTVQPPGRFGVVAMNDSDRVTAFEEKPRDEIGWINGGYFVLEPSVLDLIEDDQEIWERRPMVTLAERGELYGFKHKGFWLPCDTLRDKQQLESLWQSGKAPWRVWGGAADA